MTTFSGLPTRPGKGHCLSKLNYSSLQILIQKKFRNNEKYPENGLRNPGIFISLEKWKPCIEKDVWNKTNFKEATWMNVKVTEHVTMTTKPEISSTVQQEMSVWIFSSETVTLTTAVGVATFGCFSGLSTNDIFTSLFELYRGKCGGRDVQ